MVSRFKFGLIMNWNLVSKRQTVDGLGWKFIEG